MRITRRHLLALSAGTTAAAALVAGGVVAQWWDQPPEEPFSVLDNDEAGFIRAWAGAAYPSTPTIPLHGHSAGLDRFFDHMLKTMPSDSVKLLRLLINALNNATYPTDRAAFSALPQPRQKQIFDDWIHSDLDPFRSATQSLVLLLGMGWSIHPDVRPHMLKLHSCGYGK